MTFLGGVREALFGDQNYHLIWKQRKGFAKIAIEAKVVSDQLIGKNHVKCIIISLLYQCLQKIVEKPYEQ